MILPVLFALWGLEPSKCVQYFVYLKAPNMRSIRVRKGPNPKTPVACILTTPKYPLKVVQKYDNWIQIADHEGPLGWVHKSFVTSNGKRYGMTLSECSLTQKDKNTVLAHLPKGFILTLLHKIDNNWLVVAKDPTDGKHMTGLVPCSVIWGE